MSARTDRTIALIAGGILALFFTICGAGQVAGWTVGSVERSAHRVIPGPVTELNIDAGAGDITLVPARTSEITIDSRAEGSLHTPRLDVRVDGTDVTVDGGCPEVTFGRCGAQLVVHVPDGTMVHVKASSGDLMASGLSGDVDLRTSSGDVRVDGLGGNASIKSASGDVEGTRLRGSAVQARTSSGDARLEFASAPTAAEAWTASGDATIEVPPGDELYVVDVETKSGHRELGVNDSMGATRVLRAFTSSGDATVDYGRF
jgi:hypothetical protein